MESYQTHTLLEEQYGKLINVKLFNDGLLKRNNHETNMLNNLLILQMSKG